MNHQQRIELARQLAEQERQKHERDKQAVALLVEAIPLFEKFEQIDGTDILSEADEIYIQNGPQWDYLACVLSALGTCYFHFTQDCPNWEIYSQQLADWQNWYEQETEWEAGR